MNDLSPALALPYPGLRPFRESDHKVFFGREVQLNNLLEQLEEAPFVAVVGSSGSGKSSLVKAGLLPLIRAGFLFGTEDWVISVSRPGHQPYKQLAEQLATNLPGLNAAIVLKMLCQSDNGLINVIHAAKLTPEDHILIVIDQFEELFGFRHNSAGNLESKEGQKNVASRDLAAAFVAMLMTTVKKADKRIHLILTMRSDFIGDCDLFLGLPEVVSKSQFLVPRLTRSQMESVIVRPGRLLEAAFEPFEFETDLVTRLVNDAGDRPDQLPLLQHALMRMWKCSNKRLLKHSDYEQSGRIVKALADDADVAFSEIGSDKLRQIAKRLFLLLCDFSNEGEFVRRRPLAGEVMDVSGATLNELKTVIKIFQRDDRNFLLPPASSSIDSETILDISHESLLRQWSQLHDWISDETLSRKKFDRLRDLTDEWKKKDVAVLMKEHALDEIVEWKNNHHPNEAWAKRYGGGYKKCLQFIEASKKQIRKEREDQVGQREKDTISSGPLGFIYKYTFGYDFFISYAWSDSRIYATALAESLKRRGFECFLDSQDYAAGDNWRKVSRAAILRTQRLIVLLTPNAIETKQVWHDLREFSARKRPIIPIDFDVSFEGGKELDGVLSPDLLRINASYKDLEIGPSTETLDAILSTFRSTSVAKRRSRLLTATFAILVVLLLVSLSTVMLARQQRNVAMEERNIAAQQQGIAESRLATMSLQNGNIAIRDREDILEGLLWYSQALRTGRRSTVSNSARSLIGGWSRSLPQYSIVLNDTVEDITFSPSGSILATTSSDGTVLLWDAKTGSEIGEALIHDDTVLKVLFSPDGATLATTSFGVASIWDVKTRKLVFQLMHTSAISALSFSPDGSIVATASKNNTTRLWDARTGALRSKIVTHSGAVHAVSFSPDGRLLATASEDKTVRIRDVQTGQPVGQPLRHEAPVTSVSFSPDGRVMAAASDNIVQLWNVMTGEPIGLFPAKLDTPVRSFTFIQGGSVLATVSSDGTVQLWDTSSGQSRDAQIKLDRPIFVATFSPDGESLATGSIDGTVRVWDLGELESGIRLDVEPTYWLAFSPDGKTLASESISNDETNGVRLWDVSTGMPHGEPFKYSGLTIRASSFSTDGLWIATGGIRSPLRGWEVLSRRLLHEYQYDYPNFGTIAYSPNGKTLAILSEDYTNIELWDTRTELLPTILKHDNPVRIVEFDPSGRIIATVVQGQTVQLWDVATGQLRGEIQSGEDVSALIFSHEANTIFIASYDDFLNRGKARTWKLGTLEPVGEEFLLGEKLTSVSFSPNSLTIAGATLNEVRLWDLQTGKLRIDPLRHERRVDEVSFSPDGRTLATVSDDGGVRLWEVHTGQQLSPTFQYPRFSEVKATFSPGGEMLAIASVDGLHLLPVSSPVVDDPECVQLSVEVRTGRTIEYERVRSLTQAEWLARRSQLKTMGGDCLNQAWDD